MAAMSSGKEERETSQHKFKVQMYDFACEGLPHYEKAELFLKINFDQFKIFKTDHEINTTSPEWGFKAGFVYCMEFLEKLKTRVLKIQCFNRRSEFLIGEVSIDLQTVACGPPKFELTLKAPGSGELRGVLKFTCVMKMISQDLTVVLRDMKLTIMETPAAARIDVTTSLDENQRLTLPHNQQGQWEDPVKISLETTLCDLLKAAPACETLQFVVIDESGMTQGEAQLSFRDYFDTRSEKEHPFNVEVTYSAKNPGEDELENMGSVGALEGTIFYQNLPVYAQMVGGSYIDGQIEGGFYLFKGLPYPNVLSEPPPLWQDDNDDQRPDEENELNLDDVDDDTFYAALEQIDLPPPWEKRRDRASDKQGNRMYFLDPRTRRTTYKDPRFVPENWDQRIDAQTGKVYFIYHKVRGSTFLDPRGCPKDWEMRLSKDQDVYFAYLPSMKTTWNDPRGLPEHSEACLDDLGRMFFKDNEKKETTWQDPRSDQQEVLLTQWRQAQMSRWLREQVFAETENRKKNDEDGKDDDSSDKR